jgi:hypothetical protein
MGEEGAAEAEDTEAEGQVEGVELAEEVARAEEGGKAEEEQVGAVRGARVAEAGEGRR